MEAIQRRVRALIGDLPCFPSLLIGRDSLIPQGTFAEAQAQYLQPQAQQVGRVRGTLVFTHWGQLSTHL